MAELLDLGAEEVVGDLGEDAGAVAGLGVGVDRAAVGQGADAAQGGAQDLLGTFPVDAGDEADAAGVVLLGGVIESLARVGAKAIENGLVQHCGKKGRKTAGRSKGNARDYVFFSERLREIFVR